MIQFSQIIPHPLKEASSFNSSEIWNTELTFEQGKNYLIEAPSGKGKSTFLHIIYGIRKDFDGNARINNETTNAFSNDQWTDLRQTTLSIVFQDLRLFEDLTALENIQIKNQLARHYSDEKILEMAEKLGVHELLPKPLYTLSYGQRQRIAIIRALCQPFKYLLLDEPFSNLDEANIRIASELIKEACEQNRAGLILVSLGERFFFEYDQIFQL